MREADFPPDTSEYFSHEAEEYFCAQTSEIYNTGTITLAKSWLFGNSFSTIFPKRLGSDKELIFHEKLINTCLIKHCLYTLIHNDP